MGRLLLTLALGLSAALFAAASAGDSESVPMPRLWDTMGAPVQMTPARVAEAGLDEAEFAARREYERRILGSLNPHAEKRGNDTPPPSFASPPASNEVFVTVDLALKESSELKDAVAGLSRASGFRSDARFDPQLSSVEALSGPPLPTATRRIAVRGWVAADRLSEAVRLPGVLRVEVEHVGPRPQGAAGAATTLLVGLRIPSRADASETFRRVLAELAASARFQWRRTIGFQTLPGSKDVALLVVGELPVTRLPRLLEHASVLKVAPASLAPGAPLPKQAPHPSRLERFWDYILVQAPLLLILTLLVLLPSAGGLLLRFVKTFVPYH